MIMFFRVEEVLLVAFLALAEVVLFPLVAFLPFLGDLQAFPFLPFREEEVLLVTFLPFLEEEALLEAFLPLVAFPFRVHPYPLVVLPLAYLEVLFPLVASLPLVAFQIQGAFLYQEAFRIE